MGNILRLATNETRPIRGGYDFFWAAMLEVSTPDNPLFTYRDIDGKCDFGHEDLLTKFLRELVRGGYIEIAVRKTATGGAHTYRLLKRQRETPSFTRFEGAPRKGQAQLNMWNVMRRSHQGFTIAELALSASTDTLIVARQTAKDYCHVLHAAGILSKLEHRTGGKVANTYVLRGSANTGPKAPVRYHATMIFDPNTGLIAGDTVAHEVTA